MRVTRIGSESELEKLRPEWNPLSDGIPFRSWQWLHSWWGHYGKDRELFVLAVRSEDGTLVGIAPWLVEKQAVAGRVIRFLGTGEVCSDHLNLLVNPKHENAVMRALADWLVRHASDKKESRWDLLKLEGVTGDATIVRKLAACLRAQGCAVHGRMITNGWRLCLPENWDDLVARLGKSTRRKVRQHAKQILGSDHLSVELANDLAEFPRAMSVLVELHQRRRNSLGQAGCFCSASFTHFISDVAARMLPTGNLQLPILRIDGHPVACQLNLVQLHTTYHYQAGIAPDFLKHSPGNLMMTAILRQAVSKGQTHFDFLRGDERYKANWRAERYPVWEFRVASHNLKSQLLHQAWRSASTTKRWLKGALHDRDSFRRDAEGAATNSPPV